MTGRVYLVGMPGSGKSSVGRALARRLGAPFVDLDREVERRAGATIPQLFAAEGEEGFRRREAEALRAVADGPAAVVACGGGVVLRGENRALLRSTGTVVHLEAPVEVLAGRLAGSHPRPVVGGPEDLPGLLASRAEAYRAARHHAVDASGPAEEVAARVEALLR